MDKPNEQKDINISARAVLQHLNSLGYTNVSGQQLKCFIKDLKKLIKYDLQQKEGPAHSTTETTSSGGPERLHDIPTYSWKSKCTNKENKSSQKRQQAEKDVEEKKVLGDKVQNAATKIDKVARKENKPERPKSTVSIKSGSLIKVQQAEKPKKSDPVALYHYYASLWEKYKPNLPGENDWAELRWSVREKLIGTESATSVRRSQSATKKQRPRKEWVN